ncbi:MAG: haloacid dehalogenase-like hydrolase [Chloroflexi bacterium]|nr:haloacid dehalogenase-like hydrolase [Chloroflexota bacterium]
MNKLLDNRPITFFDIDGVLVRPWIIYYFPMYLSQLNPPCFSQRALLDMREHLESYRQNGDYIDFARKWMIAYAHGVRGAEVHEIEQNAIAFWNLHWNDYVYPYTVSLVKNLKEFTTLVAISASPAVALRPLCLRLQIDYVEGLEAEEEGNIYTGEIDLSLMSKDQAVSKYIKNLSSLQKSQSFAFGDSVHDYPLLEHVGNPYFVTDKIDPELRSRGETAFRGLSSQNPKIVLLYRDETPDGIVNVVRERTNQVFDKKS